MRPNVLSYHFFALHTQAFDFGGFAVVMEVNKDRFLTVSSSGSHCRPRLIRNAKKRKEKKEPAGNFCLKSLKKRDKRRLKKEKATLSKMKILSTRHFVPSSLSLSLSPNLESI
jgi:hypothetical protein